MQSMPHGPRRRRHAILLERLEERVLFDVAPATTFDPSAQPPGSPLALSLNDMAETMDESTGNSKDLTDSNSFEVNPALGEADTIENAFVVDGIVESRALAFPGAEGLGAYAQGGRGGDVYHVTNLNNHGPGSLREGIDTAAGPRTIVFDISGTIELTSRLTIDEPYLTIAGQTTPGEGITLRNYGTAIIDTHDVIIRYVRFRLGDTIVSEQDSLLIYNSRDVMIDHISASWSVDETIDTSNSSNVTIQWSIISEGLHDSNHPKGAHSSGSFHAGGSISFHHNLFAHNNWRNPLIRQQADIVNNVIYNWGTNATIAGWSNPIIPDPDGSTQVNLQGNYYIAGPSTVNPSLAYLGHPDSQLWASDNLLDSNQNGVLDGVAVTAFTGWSEMMDVPFEFATVRAEDPRTAYDRVLREAGASLSRDAIDRRIVDDVLNETGRVIDSQDEVGGFPQLRSMPAQADTDQDGMPDHWENSFPHLDPSEPSDRNHDENRDGLTNLEDYLSTVAANDPVVQIVAPIGAEVGETVNFSWRAANRLADGNVAYTIEIDWDGDDQVEQTLQGPLTTSVDHVFDRPGSHQVNVTLTGPQGQTARAVHTVEITASMAVPDVSVSGPSHATTGIPLRFTINGENPSSDNNHVYRFLVDWDRDGHPATTLDGPLGSQIEHVFREVGLHTLRVTLIDSHGQTATTTHNVLVTDNVTSSSPALSFNIVGRRFAQLGEVLTFTLVAVAPSHNNDQPHEFYIDWNGDGHTDERISGSLGMEISHVFEHWGRYTLRVSLRDAAGTEQASASNTVLVTSGLPATLADIEQVSASSGRTVDLVESFRRSQNALTDPSLSRPMLRSVADHPEWRQRTEARSETVAPDLSEHLNPTRSSKSSHVPTNSYRAELIPENHDALWDLSHGVNRDVDPWAVRDFRVHDERTTGWMPWPSAGVTDYVDDQEEDELEKPLADWLLYQLESLWGDNPELPADEPDNESAIGEGQPDSSHPSLPVDVSNSKRLPNDHENPEDTDATDESKTAAPSESPTASPGEAF